MRNIAVDSTGSKQATTRTSRETIAHKNYVDVIRGKDERSMLPGHSCVECEKYIAVIRDQGLVKSDDEIRAMLQKCSRHKSAAGPPPNTPDGFWDLSVYTPDDWKQSPGEES